MPPTSPKAFPNMLSNWFASASSRANSAELFFAAIIRPHPIHMARLK